ncbi:MAG: hypothetical protein B9S32_02870 [Verrucomicrobia bacterium Tous-C9LFEB]|nr:MAG: hypothetical protein B9S32_02870 [Verrucomicrobia bacterium Tous-C9LFEB]
MISFLSRLVLSCLVLPGFLVAADVSLDFSKVANRAFVDDVSGDGKGGWSDQGPDNSLSRLKAGTLSLGDIGFTILDGPQAILVLESGLLTKAEVSVPDSAPEDGGVLYLLHTACRAGRAQEKIGTITVRYASGKTVEFPVETRRELDDWWGPGDKPNGVVAYREENNSAQVGAYASRFVLPKGMGRPVAVQFVQQGSPIWIVIAATLSPVDRPLPKRDTWTVTANEEWRPYQINNDNIDIVPGSALDFSTLFPSGGEAGKDGFLKINEKGQFVFEKAPNQPVKFFCDMPQMIFLHTLTPEKIERFADQVARGGYNIYRTQFLDYALMHLSTEDHVFNPKHLDAWDRFAAALKKRGIYLQLDITTSWASFYATPNHWNQDAHNKRLRSRMYYDPTAREHWKKGVKLLLEHVNPYTGVALKDEPQVAIVQMRNEAGIDFLMGTKEDSDPDIINPFRAWLKKKYGTTEGLRKAWSRKDGDALISDLPRSQTIETVPLPPRSSSKASTRDLMWFYTEIERETYQWMAATVREIGVKVPLTEYNNGGSLQVALSRDIVQVSDNHAYHDLPHGDAREVGSTQDGNSSLTVGVSYFRYLASTRFWGRPFLCTEWGHVFWNAYRYEAGLTVPAYASLQGWEMLTHFGVRDELEVKPIIDCVISFDPPLKAAEYMSALFYRRGDVKTSPHKVEVIINPNLPDKPLALQNAMSSTLNRLSLVTGLGIHVEGMPDSAPRASVATDLTLLPDAGEKIISGSMDQRLGGDNTPTAQQAGLIAQLREKGILSKDNETNPDKGIYESDTGEILLDQNKKQITVVTPYSQGVALAQTGMEASLPGFRVKNNGAGVSVFLGALGQKPQPLAESHRLLFITATDALNNGMTFADEKRNKVLKIGALPILLRVAKVDAKILHQKPAQLKMWALGYSGKRMEEIPLKVEKDGVSVSIDTGKLKNGPTPFFELAVVDEKK